MIQRTVTILDNVRLAERTFRIRLECPEIAALIRPGQFLMLKIPGTDPLLGRPFALYDTVLDNQSRPVAIDVVYLVIGKMTGLLAALRVGEMLEIWGPLGNGFQPFPDWAEINCVAGGIGQTPFLAYVRDILGIRGYGGQLPRRKADRVRLFYGVRSAEFAAGVEDFRQAGADIHLASDDGSLGYQGFVTSLVESTNPAGPLVGCGPELMLHSLARLAEKWQRLCHVSLETPMACGFGVCFSCVTKVKCDSGWDYKRVCIDGPIFESSKLEWE